jgi:hypothetical protein
LTMSQQKRPSLTRWRVGEEKAVRLLLITMIVILSACQQGELAKHRQATERLLTQRGAPDFADASTAEFAAIRHTPSGMICVLPVSGVFEFDVFPASVPNAGAQCSSTEGEVLTAWIAVDFREPTTLDAAFATAVAQITRGLTAQNWLGRPSEADLASPEGMPHFRIHRVRANFDGEERYLRLSIAEMDGWYLQQIVSAPLSDAPAAEAVAGTTWRRGLAAFAQTRREQASAAAGAQ